MVSVRGGGWLHLPRILWDDFSITRWLDFSHGTLWDRLRYTCGFFWHVRNLTHTSNHHLLFLWVSEGVVEVEWLDTLTLHNWWICQGSWTLLDCSWTTSGCHRQVFGSFERCEWQEMSLKKSWSLEERWQEFAKVLPTLQKTEIFLPISSCPSLLVRVCCCEAGTIGWFSSSQLQFLPPSCVSEPSNNKTDVL